MSNNSTDIRDFWVRFLSDEVDKTWIEKKSGRRIYGEERLLAINGCWDNLIDWLIDKMDIVDRREFPGH